VPNFYQNLCESFYNFIFNIVVQQAGARAIKYVPFCVTLFVLICSMNVIGLIPFGFTPTSHLAMTFFLALTCNMGLLILCMNEQGVRVLLLFIPKGVPILLLPIIAIIEFISYLLRSFSLAIRLFANMMAGHTLLHILAGFGGNVFTMNSSDLGRSVALLIVLILVLAIYILEFAIAFLQAYVFVVLFTIYLNEALNFAH